uniref:Uncharacterized protein n=1 Tax=Anopheles melas TaxID=34690 RepID=A0A182UG07_9DIPT
MSSTLPELRICCTTGYFCDCSTSRLMSAVVGTGGRYASVENTVRSFETSSLAAAASFLAADAVVVERDELGVFAPPSAPPPPPPPPIEPICPPEWSFALPPPLPADVPGLPDVRPAIPASGLPYCDCMNRLRLPFSSCCMNSFMFGIGGSPPADDEAELAPPDEPLLEVMVEAADVATFDPLAAALDDMLRLRLCSSVSLICELERPEAAATCASAVSADRPYSSPRLPPCWPPAPCPNRAA